MRTIVVGDIHGCYQELLDLLNKVKLANDDRVVAVGDLTVKGPSNLEVVELFRKDDRFSSVMGNHDLAVVRRWRNEPIPLKKVQESAYLELAANEQCLHYLANLPLVLELDGHVVIHAGLRPRVPLSDQSIDDLTELRTLGPDRRSRVGVPWYEEYNDSLFALFGHWPAAEPRRGPNALGLDTGCVYGYELTALILETGEIVSVPARQSYVRPDTQPGQTSDLI
jgi:diadenosine tetraphosphatase ApaH/serine/threonine PP2A family protein phosphatase